MKVFTAFLASAALLASIATAQNVVQVTRATQSRTTAPRLLTDYLGTLYFVDRNGPEGEELWTVDPGNVPRLFMDVRPGPEDSRIQDLAVLNDRLLFSAYHDDATVGLWASDGTAAGTVPIFEHRGVPIGFPIIGNFDAVLERKAFISFNYGSTYQLLVTDGTAAGTRALLTIPSVGIGVQLIQPVGVFDGEYYFSANYAPSGILGGLWRTDGSTAGTQQVWSGWYSGRLFGRSGNRLVYFDLVPPHGHSLWSIDLHDTGGPQLLLSQMTFAFTWGFQPATFRDRVYFWARDDVNGGELWSSDGTPGGTSIVHHMQPGSAGTAIEYLTPHGDRLYFSADGQGLGRELYRTDGTSAGTALVRDINPGAGESRPWFSAPSELDRFLYFAARRPAEGEELWVSDGTWNGTRLLYDLNPGAGSSSPRGFTLSGSRLYFLAMNSAWSMELWALDPVTSAKAVGRGCGAGGPIRMDSTDPILGSMLRITFEDSPIGAPGIVFLSPVPRLGTTPISGANCNLYLDLQTWIAPLTAFTPVQNPWRERIYLPADPALVGARFAGQAVFLGAAASWPLELSNGLHWTLGF